MKKVILIMLLSTMTLSAEVYRDNVENIVEDHDTGLSWQDDANPTAAWQEAIEYCEALTLGGYNDWRLPNINELKSIVDRKKMNLAIKTGFNATASSSGFYWSSSTSVVYTEDAWIVDFYHGAAWDLYKKYSYVSVRCVRGGQ